MTGGRYGCWCFDGARGRVEEGGGVAGDRKEWWGGSPECLKRLLEDVGVEGGGQWWVGVRVGLSSWR